MAGPGAGKQAAHGLIRRIGKLAMFGSQGDIVNQESGFQDTVTLSDNDATSFTPNGTEGIVVVIDDNAEGGVAHFKASSTNATTSIGGTSNFAVTTGSLGGSDGTDTNLTVSANDGDNKVYIENRTGGERDVSYIVLLQS